MSKKGRSSGSPAERHFDEGLALHRRGLREQALAAYDRALAGHPGHAPALHFSAVALHESGRSEEAALRIKRSLAIDDCRADVWSNAGLVFEAVGRLSEATRAYRRALAIEPGLAAAWTNLASLHLALDEPSAAEDAARRALAIATSHGALLNLAMALAAQGRHREVLASLDTARQRDVTTWGLRAQALDALCDAGGARAVLDEALASIDDPRLRIERARLAQTANDEANAFADYRAVLTHERVDESLRETALSETIALAKQQALWSVLPPLQAAFHDRVVAHAARGDASGLTPFTYLSDRSSRAGQKLAAEAWSRRFQVAFAVPPDLPPDLPLDASTLSDGRLRIGYLSADFHAHATGILAVGLFERHDRSRFEVVAYSTGPDDGSAMRRRLVAAFDRFVDARGWDDARLARAIAADGIDILVDLKGHTDQATTGVVARRPAPVAVSYLGYPGTMGASFVDYLIGDAIVTPLTDAADYSETLVLLPDSYQVNDDRRAIAPIPSRESLGLPADAVVLCAFNAAWKIGADVFDAWAGILRRSPAAVLWMQPRRGGSATVQRWRNALVAAGVDEQRLVIADERAHDEYLALFRQADLFLDTWPYNGHTTTSDALWAGCPVLTLRGETFAGRVAESLLAAVDRRDWATSDRGAYVERAVELANDRPRLVAMRDRLRADVRTSRLYDTEATTGAIERAFIEMARQRRDGVRAPIVIGREARGGR